MDGAVVCGTHGGSAPQVKKRAAERILMAADDAASRLVKWMADDSVPIGERRKIAEGLLDRAGLAAGKAHDVTVTHKFEDTLKNVVVVWDDEDEDEVVDAIEVPEPAALPAPEPLPDNVILHSFTSVPVNGDDRPPRHLR